MDKKELRKKQLELRRNFSKEIKDEEITIGQIVFDYIMDKGYKRVLTYVSTKEELDTHILIGKLLDEGIKVYVPRVEGKEMEFYQIKSFSDLKEGYKNILEPQKYCDTIDTTIKDELLILTPGLMFDNRGNRLGYGGGYYDRYMDKCQKQNIAYFSLGLCFSPLFSTDDMVPSEVTDIALNALVTKRGIINF